jgi:hypothetical protein
MWSRSSLKACCMHMREHTPPPFSLAKSVRSRTSTKSPQGCIFGGNVDSGHNSWIVPPLWACSRKSTQQLHLSMSLQDTRPRHAAPYHSRIGIEPSRKQTCWFFPNKGVESARGFNESKNQFWMLVWYWECLRTLWWSGCPNSQLGRYLWMRKSFTQSEGLRTISEWHEPMHNGSVEVTTYGATCQGGGSIAVRTCRWFKHLSGAVGAC